MITSSQPTDFVVVPVPHKSATVSMAKAPTNVPSEQLSIVNVPLSTPVLSSTPVPSGVGVDSTQRAIIQANAVPSSVPVDSSPAVQQLIDSFDLSDDQPDSSSDYDGFLETNSHHDDDVLLQPPTTHDMVLNNPRDPHGPCTVTFGNAHDLHETHQGVFTQLFEKCFPLTLGSEALHFPPGYDDGHGGHGPLWPTHCSLRHHFHHHPTLQFLYAHIRMMFSCLFLLIELIITTLRLGLRFSACIGMCFMHANQSRTSNFV